MTMQFWRNLGYLLCLVGLWFRMDAFYQDSDFLFSVSPFVFGFGVLAVAVTLVFDWIDHTSEK